MISYIAFMKREFTSSKLLFEIISKRIATFEEQGEAKSIAYLVLEKLYALSKTDILIDKEIKSRNQERMDEIMGRLTKKEPIQYILGEADFFGRKFIVDENVLIPRQETEEVVDLIKKDNRKPNLKVLDIGTGSGCIPIMLALEMNEPQVFSVDIDENCLALAKKNAALNNATVQFFQTDILKEDFPVAALDIVVSNPPYVLQSEKSVMRKKVLNFEPHLALFVADEDPLVFYKTIAKKAGKHLKKGGKLYFEINEGLGGGVKSLMESEGFMGVEIVKDLNGKDRIVWGVNSAKYSTH